jgi:hypothetical protein
MTQTLAATLRLRLAVLYTALGWCKRGSRLLMSALEALREGDMRKLSLPRRAARFDMPRPR